MDKREQTAGERADRTREQRRAAWKKWLKESERLNQSILAGTKGKPMDLDLALKAARADLEARDARVYGGDG
ncbi:MAG: hypothetical protein OXK78_15295 [Caldilineaceae bacterium]|nr:hypothetical protein [Caldilineaceae bacterium]